MQMWSFVHFPVLGSTIPQSREPGGPRTWLQFAQGNATIGAATSVIGHCLLFVYRYLFTPQRFPQAGVAMKGSTPFCPGGRTEAAQHRPLAVEQSHYWRRNIKGEPEAKPGVP